MKIIGGIIQYSLAMIAGALALFSFQMSTTETPNYTVFYFAAINMLIVLSLGLSVLVGQFNEGK